MSSSKDTHWKQRFSNYMQYGLDEKTLEKIKSVFAKFPEINKVLLYGSRAKGNYKPGSDIDLTIKNSSLDFTKLNALRSVLDDLSTPYTFDISIYENLTSDDLIEHINRAGVVFYEKAKIDYPNRPKRV